MPCPIADIGCALVKISASSPIPTSRYCDQAPCAISVALSARASLDPGTNRLRSPPSCAATCVRIASAFSGAPLACSSITRSSIERANVTPAALIACRSTGANSHGRSGSRVASGVLAIIEASPASRVLSALRTRSAASARSQRSRIVGTIWVMSWMRSPRMATMHGPALGLHTRAARAARLASCGNVAASVINSRIPISSQRPTSAASILRRASRFPRHRMR